ncbi:MAG: type VI secretion system tip protein VgrG [Bacteroidota bacterium]
MAQSPVNSKTDLITFTILADGTEIDSSYEVLSIHVTKSINQIPGATVILLDGNAAKSDFEVSNKADFLPGVDIEIKAGYHSKESTIFKGIVVRHGITASDSGSELKLDCKDKAYKMTIGRKNAYYLDKKDSDIISSLVSGSGLQVDVDATTYQHKSMLQYHATDWDFLMTRAEANGLITVVNDGEVSVKKPDTSTSPDLVISYGSDMLEFSAEIDSSNPLKSIKGFSWDSSTQKVVNGAGKASIIINGNLTTDTLSEVLGIEDFDLQSNGMIEAADLKNWAIAKDVKAKLSAIQGYVKFQGSSLALPGKMIQLKGVGDRFNGNAFISAVHHAIEDGQWTSEVEFGIDNTWYIEDKPNVSSVPASGLLPAVSGLQIGIVKQVHEDPDGSFRVLTKIPILQQDKEALWCRLATYYASNECGNFFYPEVDDEVILGFMNDDPRYPVILGSVYSKKNKAPLTPEQKNEKKAIITKSKLELSFDEQNKVIVIKTPGNNQITISDKDEGIKLEDQNSNSITLDSSGIALDSASNIAIKSQGNVTIEAEGNLEQTAKANVAVNGLKIDCMAKTSFIAKGNASAELSASGQTEVKGSIVMIN